MDPTVVEILKDPKIAAAVTSAVESAASGNLVVQIIIAFLLAVFGAERLLFRWQQRKAREDGDLHVPGSAIDIRNRVVDVDRHVKQNGDAIKDGLREHAMQLRAQGELQRAQGEAISRLADSTLRVAAQQEKQADVQHDIRLKLTQIEHHTQATAEYLLRSARAQ